ncbi:MAG: hypothetical protein AAGI71_03170 [Bacteroidota bacterium]
MSLSFGLNPWLLALCVLLAAGLTAWMYRTTVPPLPLGRRALLMGLRTAALTLVLFLLFEPLLTRITTQTQPAVLAVLVDDSQSLTLRTGDDSLATAHTETVQALLADVQQRQSPEAVQLFRFGANTAPLPTPDSLGFDDVRTDIGAALAFVQDALRNDNLGGVLLISDGRYNTGRNPLYVAERFPVPIYTATVGDTTSRRDLLIQRITSNDLAYVNTEVPVEVTLRAVEGAGESVTLSLLDEGTILGTANAQLPTGTGEVTIPLTFVPDAEGLQRLTVSATRLDGEATYRNNASAFTVRVLESKRRLLLLAAAPSPDVAALRRLLQTDPNTEVTARVQRSSGQFYEGTFPDPSTFDAIILAGYPGRTAEASQIRQVAEAAAEGTPLLFVLNQQTDLRLTSEYLADVLPATPDRVRSSFLEASFVPTSAGTRHPVLDLPDVRTTDLRRLPPLLYNESRWIVSPDARVLAQVQIRGVQLDDPLLVIRRRGTARSAALLGAGTWRWQNLPDDLSSVGSFWPVTLANMVQWITTPEDTRRVRVDPTTDLFPGGTPVELTGQVYDESLNPISDAVLDVTVTAPDGAQYAYQMDGQGTGRYRLDAGVLPEGTYQYRAQAQRDGESLGTDQGRFAVGALNIEFRETRADAALMRQIAQRSAGQPVALTEIATLSDELASSGNFDPLVLEDTREVPLWHRYGFLIAILVLLTLEWFFRKRSGMA